MPDYPTLGKLRRDPLGSWTAEADLTPELRISVMYASYPDTVPSAKIETAVRETLERVARDEAGYRLRAARAWLPTFHAQRPKTAQWSEEELARTFTLRGVILGNHPTFILAHATSIDVDKDVKTWFKPDGSLSHISGDLD